MNPNHVLSMKSLAALPTDITEGDINPSALQSIFTLPTSAGYFAMSDTIVNGLSSITKPVLASGDYDEVILLGHRLISEGSLSMVMRVSKTQSGSNGSHTFNPYGE